MTRTATGNIIVNPNNKEMLVMFNADLGRYYNWFVCKNEWISLHPPLHGIHLTFTNKKLNNNQFMDWNKARSYNNKKITIEYDVDLREGGSAQKGFRNFYLKVNDKQIEDIKNDVGIIETSNYYGAHITIGSTKGTEKKYWPELITLNK